MRFTRSSRRKAAEVRRLGRASGHVSGGIGPTDCDHFWQVQLEISATEETAAQTVGTARLCSGAERVPDGMPNPARHRIGVVVIRRIRWSARMPARWSPELTSGRRRALIEAPPRARGWQAPVVPQLMRFPDDSSATHPNRPRADRGVRHHRGPCSLPGGPRPRRLSTRLDSRTAEARGARASGSGHASTPPFRGMSRDAAHKFAGSPGDSRAVSPAGATAE